MSRRGLRRAGLAAAGVLLLAAVLIVVLLPNRGQDTIGPDPGRVAELQAQEVERNATQVAELTELARSVHDSLLPVLAGLTEALPMEGSPNLVSEDQAAAWRGITDAAVDSLADPPSGATGHNIARGGLRTAVELFAATLAAYELALAVDGEQRADLVELAVDLRLQAVRAWSVAATQLDDVNIAAGHGHVHIYLPADPGSGALAPDPFPEGSEAHDPEGHS